MAIFTTAPLAKCLMYCPDKQMYASGLKQTAQTEDSHLPAPLQPSYVHLCWRRSPLEAIGCQSLAQMNDFRQIV